MSCVTCKQALESPWDRDTILKQAIENNLGWLTEDEIEDRIDICNVCPFRKNSACMIRNVPILTWIVHRHSCPENFWPAPLPAKPEEHFGIIVDDHGNVTKNGVTTQNPCGDCKYRRRNVKWTDPPEINPFCTLFEKPVAWEICCSCDEKDV